MPRNFHKLVQGVVVEPILGAIAKHPELWNQCPWRQEYQGTPHGEVDDILIRYSDLGRMSDLADTSAVQNDPGAVWFPVAKTALGTAVRPFVINLMHSVNGYSLERLVLSRLRPGGRILPHADNVGEYVHQGDIARYHLVLQGLPGSMFRCGDETIQMLTGEVWWFNAHLEHEVLNNSVEDRIHLMVDLKFWE